MHERILAQTTETTVCRDKIDVGGALQAAYTKVKAEGGRTAQQAFRSGWSDAHPTSPRTTPGLLRIRLWRGHTAATATGSNSSRWASSRTGGCETLHQVIAAAFGAKVKHRRTGSVDLVGSPCYRSSGTQ